MERYVVVALLILRLACGFPADEQEQEQEQTEIGTTAVEELAANISSLWQEVSRINEWIKQHDQSHEMGGYHDHPHHHHQHFHEEDGSSNETDHHHHHEGGSGTDHHHHPHHHEEGNETDHHHHPHHHEEGSGTDHHHHPHHHEGGSETDHHHHPHHHGEGDETGHHHHHHGGEEEESPGDGKSHGEEGDEKKHNGKKESSGEDSGESDEEEERRVPRHSTDGRRGMLVVGDSSKKTGCGCKHCPMMLQKNREAEEAAAKDSESKIIQMGNCKLKPNVEMPESKVEGNITIFQRSDWAGPLYYQISLRGVAVNEDGTGSIHGFHIHENRVTDGRCSTAGAHFNPTGSTHGSLYSSQRHLGDLGNIKVDSEGNLENYVLTDSINQIKGPEAIISKSFVVHELEDDLGLVGDEGSLSTGNAGKRLACCTIYVSMSPTIRFNG